MVNMPSHALHCLQTQVFSLLVPHYISKLATASQSKLVNCSLHVGVEDKTGDWNDLLLHGIAKHCEEVHWCRGRAGAADVLFVPLLLLPSTQERFRRLHRIGEVSWWHRLATIRTRGFVLIPSSPCAATFLLPRHGQKYQNV